MHEHIMTTNEKLQRAIAAQREAAQMQRAMQMIQALHTSLCDTLDTDSDALSPDFAGPIAEMLRHARRELLHCNRIHEMRQEEFKKALADLQAAEQNAAGK